MRFEDVQRLEGAFTGTNKKLTIGILVARSKDKFTDPAKDRAKVAKSAGYNIILTDEHDLYLDLINFIESHPLDNNSSNNIFFFHFYNIVIIFFLVFISFMLVLIWLNNQNKEDITIYVY